MRAALGGELEEEEEEEEEEEDLDKVVDEEEVYAEEVINESVAIPFSCSYLTNQKNRNRGMRPGVGRRSKQTDLTDELCGFDSIQIWHLEERTKRTWGKPNNKHKQRERESIVLERPSR
jgi:hypothetical protein